MISREINVSLTAKEIASEFWNLDDTGQAEFFNYLFEITGKWPRSFCYQLQSVADNTILNDGGRYIMELIGEYSKK